MCADGMIPQNWLDRLLPACRIRSPFGGIVSKQDYMEKRPTAADEVEAADAAKGASETGVSGDQGAGVAAAAAELAQEGLGPVGRYRWVICGLLFFATTVNYVDRNVLAVLSPMLQTKIGWT